MATDANRPHVEPNDDIDEAKARLARQMLTPWWYKMLAGLIIGALIVGLGMTFDSFPFGGVSIGVALIVVALCSGPVMMRILKRSTGVAVDRYGTAWTKVTIAASGVLILALLAQQFLAWTWALVIAAVLGFITTVLFEIWVDARLRRGHFPDRETTG